MTIMLASAIFALFVFHVGVLYPELMITGSLKWFLIVSKTASSSGVHKNSFVPSLHLNSSALKCCVNRSLFVWFKIAVLIFLSPFSLTLFFFFVNVFSEERCYCFYFV